MTASQAELSRIIANKDLSDLYLPPKEENASIPIKKVGTPFHRPFKQVLWHSGTPVRLEVIGTCDSSDGEFVTISYRVSSGISMEGSKTKLKFYSNRYLFTTSAKLSFPGVKVRPEHIGRVQISWSPCAALYYCVRSEFKINDVVYDGINSSWIDDFYSWNLESDVEDFNRSILNVLDMTAWTTELKAGIAEYMLPHFYTYSPSSSFPLFLIDESIKVTQELTVPKNIASYLLRIRIRDGDQWVRVEYKDARNLLEIERHSSPVLMSDIFDISPAESEKNREESTIVIPIQRVLSIRRPNTTKSGTSDEIFINGDDPVVAMFIKCKNVEAEKYNDRGNCVDTLDETENSTSSMSQVRLNYGQLEKFLYREEDVRANRMRRFFTSIPQRRGRYAHAFSISPFNPMKLAGMLPDNELKAVLTCQMTGKIAEVLPEEVHDDSDVISAIIAKSKSKTQERIVDDNGNHYRVEVNMMIHSDLIFTKNENGTYDIKVH